MPGKTQPPPTAPPPAPATEEPAPPESGSLDPSALADKLVGKRYILATGRVDGWFISLERRHKEDIAPAAYESRLELFETAEGAALAIQPEWFLAYKDEDNPPTFVEGGCSLGQNCIFYYYERLDEATNLTYLQYQIAFTYQNVLIWVMGRCPDVDVNPDVVVSAAEIILDKLERTPARQPVMFME